MRFTIRFAAAAPQIARRIKNYLRPALPAPTAVSKCRSSGGHLYVIDFNPRIKTKPGKLRPALVLQSDLINEAEYPSTIVIPTTTLLVESPGILRFRLQKGQGGVSRDSDLLLAQMIAVANESFRQEIGSLPNPLMEELENRIRIILSL
ncbi:MAG TPA: type II toxin-antitoxin system PemK/MazF family toxin [Candidatus Binatia bacterium]|nr:type II toxin-antitoxin system PemK/MazF family toxin [Candidatus Binatia bacterium]